MARIAGHLFLAAQSGVALDGLFSRRDLRPARTERFRRGYGALFGMLRRRIGGAILIS